LVREWREQQREALGLIALLGRYGILAQRGSERNLGYSFMDRQSIAGKDRRAALANLAVVAHGHFIPSRSPCRSASFGNQAVLATRLQRHVLGLRRDTPVPSFSCRWWHLRVAPAADLAGAGMVDRRQEAAIAELALGTWAPAVVLAWPRQHPSSATPDPDLEVIQQD